MSTAGYSNVLVKKALLKRKINPIIKSAKRSGTPPSFGSYDKMAANAWLANIVRFSTEKADQCVYLVNPTIVLERVRSSKTSNNLANGKSQETGWKSPALFIAHRTSPFLPIVTAIARNGGSVAGVQVRLKRVRDDVESAVDVPSLGFLKFSLYVKEAISVQLVTVHIPENTSIAQTISLRANWDYLQCILAPVG